MSQLSYSYFCSIRNFPIELNSPPNVTQCLPLSLSGQIYDNMGKCWFAQSGIQTFYNENKSLKSVDSAVVRFPAAKIVINWVSEVKAKWRVY